MHDGLREEKTTLESGLIIQIIILINKRKKLVIIKGEGSDQVSKVVAPLPCITITYLSTQRLWSTLVVLTATQLFNSS